MTVNKRDSNFTAKELEKFFRLQGEIFNEFESINTEDSVGKAVDIAMSVLSADYDVVPQYISENKDKSWFLFINGGLVAFAKFLDDEDPTVELNFHISCLPTTAIRLNSLLATMIDIPVISTDVFYAEAANNGEHTKIYYNKRAVEMFTANKYRRVREDVESQLEKERIESLKQNGNDDRILH